MGQGSSALAPVEYRSGVRSDYVRRFSIQIKLTHYRRRLLFLVHPVEAHTARHKATTAGNSSSELLSSNQSLARLSWSRL